MDSLCLSLTFQHQGCPWHLMSTRTEVNRGHVDPEEGCWDGARAGAGDRHDQSSSEGLCLWYTGKLFLWKP